MPTDPSTRDLIDRARTGDRKAFEGLVSRYRGRLRALLATRIGPRLRGKLEAEDIIQDTLVKAFQCLDRFEWRGEESFFRWLAGIANHRLLHLSRQHLRVERLPLDFEAPAGDESPGRKAQRQERFDRLEQALAGLSPDHRQVILLARIQGLPVLEIAKRMDRSPKAVQQLLWRALQKLKSSFGETESFRLPDRRLGGAFKDEEPANGS
jgi:RNA polymerase sigma-70 factor (ECF subfamily)